jgi:hypothetical protein
MSLWVTDTGGGGGGWWGGKSTASNNGGGGGGSSYISGFAGSLAAKTFNADMTKPAVINYPPNCTGAGISTGDVECSYSPDNGLHFFNARMIDGGGCEWSSSARTGTCGVMPTPYGGTYPTGNYNSGYAMISKVKNIPTNFKFVSGGIDAFKQSDTEEKLKYALPSFNTTDFESSLGDIPLNEINLPDLEKAKYQVMYSTNQQCIDKLIAGTSTAACTGADAILSTNETSQYNGQFRVSGLDPDKTYYATIKVYIDGQIFSGNYYYDKASFKTGSQETDPCALACKIY